MFRASSAHHQEYLKLARVATGTCVIVAGRSSHHLIRPNMLQSTERFMMTRLHSTEYLMILSFKAQNVS